MKRKFVTIASCIVLLALAAVFIWTKANTARFGHKTEKTPIVIFYYNACESCDEEATYVDIFKNQLKDVRDKHPYEIWLYNVYRSENRLKYREVIASHGLNEEDAALPLMVIGEDAVSGKEQIQKKLRPLLLSQGNTANDTSSPLKLIIQMIGTGFVNGLNPCAASMLFFLLAIFVVSDQSIVKVGCAYLLGRFAAYLSMGIALYYLASSLKLDLAGYMSKTLQIVFFVIAIFLAIMNTIDFFRVKRREYGKVKMQLPQKLRKWNHWIIKKGSTASVKYLFLAILILGVIISVGEFLCTGQIYTTVIIFMIKGNNTNMVAMGLLAVYVAAMSLPHMIIIIIVNKSKNLAKVSEFFLNRMPIIKLLNAVLFSIAAIWLFITL